MHIEEIVWVNIRITIKNTISDVPIKNFSLLRMNNKQTIMRIKIAPIVFGIMNNPIFKKQLLVANNKPANNPTFVLKKYLPIRKTNKMPQRIWIKVIEIRDDNL